MRSVASDNQPLYVVDGMPILNSTPEQAYSAIGGGPMPGTAMAATAFRTQRRGYRERLDPQRCPAASYGSQAANGVILVRPKGNARKQQPVTFTSNLTLQSPFSLPAFQNRYGVSDGVES